MQLLFLLTVSCFLCRDVIVATIIYDAHDFSSVTWQRRSSDYSKLMSQLDLSRNLIATEGIVPKDCVNLFQTKGKFEQDLVWPPPAEIPAFLQKEFALNGKISIVPTFMFEKGFNTGIPYNWTSDEIRRHINHPTNACGGYKKHECFNRFSLYREHIEGKSGLVVGSITPWAEVHALRLGARHVTTIEYMSINTDYPKMSTLTPSQATTAFINNTFELRDFAISYSSIEHTGLARYGDNLNPYGDIEAIRRIRCMLKPGGIFFVSFPVGKDTVYYNAHRQYGMERLPMMLEGWTVLDVLGFTPLLNLTLNKRKYFQPIFVLEKTGV